MPRAPKVCATPGCYHDQPCPTHAPEPWASSNRRTELPTNWPQLVNQVWARDHATCQRCGRPDLTRGAGEGEVDHVDPDGPHTLSNLELLCTRCHRAKTLAEAAAARRSLAGPPPPG